MTTKNERGTRQKASGDLKVSGGRPQESGSTGRTTKTDRTHGGRKEARAVGQRTGRERRCWSGDEVMDSR